MNSSFLLNPGPEPASTDELLAALRELYQVTNLCVGQAKYVAARDGAREVLESWGVNVNG